MPRRAALSAVVFALSNVVAASELLRGNVGHIHPQALGTPQTRRGRGLQYQAPQKTQAYAPVQAQTSGYEPAQAQYSGYKPARAQATGYEPAQARTSEYESAKAKSSEYEPLVEPQENESEYDPESLPYAHNEHQSGKYYDDDRSIVNDNGTTEMPDIEASSTAAAVVAFVVLIALLLICVCRVWLRPKANSFNCAVVCADFCISFWYFLPCKCPCKPVVQHHVQVPNADKADYDEEDAETQSSVPL